MRGGASTDELDDALLALGEMPTLGVTYQAGTRIVQRLRLGDLAARLRSRRRRACIKGTARFGEDRWIDGRSGGERWRTTQTGLAKG
jgi:hypothetical protein